MAKLNILLYIRYITIKMKMLIVLLGLVLISQCLSETDTRFIEPIIEPDYFRDSFYLYPEPPDLCEEKTCPDGEECRLTARCFMGEECTTTCVPINTGDCRSMIHPFTPFRTTCEFNRQCLEGEKCCQDGNSRNCMSVFPKVEAPINPPPPPVNPLNPCESMTCPENQECSVYKPCGKVDECNITAICTPKIEREGQCMSGQSLMMKDGRFLGEMFCDSDDECPSNSYCDMNILDLRTVCCIPESDQRRKRFASRRSIRRLRRSAAHANLMRRMRHLSRRAARSTQKDY